MRRIVVLTVAALLAAAVHPASYGAARRPDLTVTAVSAPAEVRSGATLAVRVTIRNAAGGRAAASSGRVYLSRDTRVGRDVAVASVRVPRLPARRSHTATVWLRVPAGTPARSYRVLACADATRKVRETKEGNNCRVAARAVRVTAPPPPPSTGDYPRSPDPLSVSPDPDEARAVTVTAMPHEDTVATATGADGTTYTLTIPAGALVGVEQVTLTPLAGLDGLPLSGGLAAGVELRPHGLQLMKPGTLTIDSPDLGPLAAQTPFYYYGAGEDLHLHPPLMPEPGDDADTIRLPILHFSTPGVGLGTPADRDGFADHPPARLPGQIAGDIADILRGEREAQQNGQPGNPEAMNQVLGLMREFYYAVVKPRLQSALASPRQRGAAFAAIQTANSWLRQMQLLGVGDAGTDATPEMQEATALLLKVLEAVYRDAWKQCSAEHQLVALPVLLQLARMAQVMGIPWGEEAFQRFLDCARFEVRFDSRIEFSGTWPVGGEQLFDYPHTGQGAWRARTTALVELSLSGGITQAPLPLTEASYHSEYSYPRSDGTTCHGWTDQTGSTPGLLSTYVIPTFQANQREVPPGEEATWEEPTVELLIVAQPTQVKDTLRVVDCGGSDSTWSESSKWLDRYRVFHPVAEDQVRATEADRSGDLLFARSWDNSAHEPNHLGGRSWEESTVLEVWHKPRNPAQP